MAIDKLNTIRNQHEWGRGATPIAFAFTFASFVIGYGTINYNTFHSLNSDKLLFKINDICIIKRFKKERTVSRDVNIFIFFKNDRFVMKTTTKNRIRSDRFF